MRLKMPLILIPTAVMPAVVNEGIRDPALWDAKAEIRAALPVLIVLPVKVKDQGGMEHPDMEEPVMVPLGDKAPAAGMVPADKENTNYD